MAENVNGNGVAEDVAEEKASTEESASTEDGTREPSMEEKVSAAASDVVETASKTINEAFKQVEKQMGSFGKALGSALQDRGNVVMVRVNDDSLRYLDMLVEADITKSRSESAAFLINEGIKSNEELFNKIRTITDQISDLKSQLRQTVSLEEEEE